MKKRLLKALSRVQGDRASNAAQVQMAKAADQLRAIAPLDAAQALASLHSQREGLELHIAHLRLHKHGPNEIAHEKAPSWAMQLYHTVRNPFVILLMVLAAINFATGDVRAFSVMMIMVAISVLLRFSQEFRSSKEAQRLKAMVTTTATVLRREPQEDGSDLTVAREVPLPDLVPGDIIKLSSGDMIPADIRLISSKDVFVSQASLTGESLPVEKQDTCPADLLDGSPMDLPNLCFMGTNVVSGTAIAVVVATGGNTYFGSLARGVVGKRVQTNFDLGVNKVSWLMIRFMIVMVPTVFALNGITKHDWMEAFLFAVSVAVGLTPEMLPMIVTTNLAKGAMAMARHKVIVKRLGSIQDFGAMDILCTDKTGTLTQDRIFLEEHVDLEGREDERVLELAYYNSYYQTGLRNQMDLAILHHSDLRERLDVDRSVQKVDEIPFDFQRRRMSVLVQRQDESGHLLVCKGAVEEMLQVCSRFESGDYPDVVVEAMTEASRAKALALVKTYNKEGFRVLAVGIRLLSGDKDVYSVQDESDLTLVGFLAFLDPPKESATPALAALREHGVQVKVLTGDNGAVTKKVCKEVGLAVDRVVLGPELEDLDDEALGRLAEEVTVFAKLSPLQKGRIIRVLRAKGHTVGFLGDGINDAAALREADIGISVDSAVDIAKDSADLILLEKSLMVLEEGVIEGRKTSANIMKYLKMTVSSNFGNMFSVLGASAWLPFLPMLPIHILVNNLMYEFTQITVPWDNVDEEYLKQPKKWDTMDISRFMLIIGPLSSVFDYATFLLMWFVFHAMTPASQGLFQAGWFVESLLSQTLVVHLLRTAKVPFFQSRPSLPLLLSSLVVVGAGMILPQTHLGAVIGMKALPPLYYLWLVGVLIGYGLLVQGVKGWYIRRYHSWL
jgi:Mg2+-importing ATPase